VKRTVTLSLHPTADQHAALVATMRAFNAACQSISDAAWEAREFRRVPVHHLTYYAVRERFNLPSQLAVRAIGVVTDSYKADREWTCLYIGRVGSTTAVRTLDLPRRQPRF